MSSTKSKLWEITEGNGPIVCVAIHDGHLVRDSLTGLLALDESDRLREEDPYTGGWTHVAGTRMIARYSRFQVDLNRTREKAVYLRPEDAWGLQVWRQPVSGDLIAESLREYDAFYAEAGRILAKVERAHGPFVVFDLHSYNHRRGGPDAPPEDPGANPEVNLGTGTLDRARWGPLIDRFLADLKAFDFLGRTLDARENVKFQGGNFSRWVNTSFPDTGCALAIEFKKIFMDEWTGELDPVCHQLLGQALAATVPGILSSLDEVSVA
jgi:N-formylglutamate deformylase